MARTKNTNWKMPSGHRYSLAISNYGSLKGNESIDLTDNLMFDLHETNQQFIRHLLG